MDFENCKDCNKKLKAVHHKRTSPKLCSKCRTWGGGGNKQTNELRELYKELIQNSTQASEDEMFFEDDPKAKKEIDYGRVFKQPTIMSYGVSPLSDIMTKTNHHFFKRESTKGIN